MPYKTETLGFALRQVSPTSPKFFIPAMQRPYVWQKEDVVKLFTSIYLGFPIGTSLVWPTKYDNPNNYGAARAYWVEINHGDNRPARQVALEQGQDITLVLDGQQRLTSLNVGVRGKWIENDKKLSLCFDPAVKASSDLFEEKPYKQAFKFIELDTEDIGHLIQCERILAWENNEHFESWLSQYMVMHGRNKNIRSEEIENNIRKLKCGFWEIEAYCYGVYPAKNVEDALNVFQLANDTGQSLDKTDLILATLQISWGRGALREEVPFLVRELNQNFPKNHRPFDQKKVLNLFFLTSDCDIPSSYRLKDFSAERVEELRKYWPRFKDQAKTLVDQISRWGFTNNRCISSINALVPILRWQVANKISYISEDNLTRIEIEKARDWLLISLLNGTFSGQSSRTLAAARDVIKHSTANYFPKKELLERLEEFHNHDFRTRQGLDRFVSELRYGDNNLRRLLMLIKRNIHDSTFEYQVDHIFPKFNYEQQYKEQVNSIANLQLLTPSENRLKSNNNPMILWSEERFDDKWREENLLTSDTEPENYKYIYDDPERLWTKRKESILNRIYDVLDI